MQYTNFNYEELKVFASTLKSKIEQDIIKYTISVHFCYMRGYSDHLIDYINPHAKFNFFK